MDTSVENITEGEKMKEVGRKFEEKHEGMDKENIEKLNVRRRGRIAGRGADREGNDTLLEDISSEKQTDENSSLQGVFCLSCRSCLCSEGIEVIHLSKVHCTFLTKQAEKKKSQAKLCRKHHIQEEHILRVSQGVTCQATQLQAPKDIPLNAHWSTEDSCCFVAMVCANCSTSQNGSSKVIGYRVEANDASKTFVKSGEIWLLLNQISTCICSRNK